jgi:hypothetical protein
VQAAAGRRLQPQWCVCVRGETLQRWLLGFGKHGPWHGHGTLGMAYGIWYGHRIHRIVGSLLYQAKAKEWPFWQTAGGVDERGFIETKWFFWLPSVAVCPPVESTECVCVVVV